MYQTQVDITDKLLTLQFQFSRLIDEVGVLKNIIMDLKLSKDTPTSLDQHQEDPDKRDIDLNMPTTIND